MLSILYGLDSSIAVELLQLIETNKNAYLSVPEKKTVFQIIPLVRFLHNFDPSAFLLLCRLYFRI